MTAYDLGYRDGLVNMRDTQIRMYETKKANDAYWEGYIQGLITANPGKRIVQCRREGRFFIVDHINLNDCICPTCGRRDINLESDRKLKVIV